MGKDKICVDFDGTIHSYASGWKGADIVSDPPFPGAIEALQLYTRYFEVNIFSSRNNQDGGINAMREWIIKWAALTVNDTSWTDLLVFPTVKPPAKVHIDDRGYRFTGTWPTVQELKHFKPFYLGRTRRDNV